MFRSAAQRFRRATLRVVVKTAVVVGGLELTTELPSKGRSSDFYHYLADQWVTPALRRFCNPEGTCVC